MNQKRMLTVTAVITLAFCSRATDIVHGDGDIIAGDVTIDPAAGETVTFRATGKVTMPATAEDRSTWPFQFHYADGNPVWGYNASSDLKMAVGEFTDAIARFTRREDGSTVADFDAGTFDFASCNGVATAGYVDFLRVQQPSSALVIHGGASLIFPTFNFVGYTLKDGLAEIDVDGGTLETKGRFLWCPGQIGVGTARSNAVRVRNGGQFKISFPGSYSSDASQFGFDYVSKTAFVLDVSGENSIFDASATCVSAGYLNNSCSFHVSDRGILRFGEFEATKGTGSSTKIVVDDGGTLESTSAFRMGVDGWGSTYDNSTSALAVTNGMVDLTTLTLGKGSVLQAKDSSLKVGSLTLNETSRGLDLDATSLVVTDKWYVDGKNHPVWGFTNAEISVCNIQFGWNGSNPTVIFRDSDVTATGTGLIGHYKGDGKVVVDGNSRLTLADSSMFGLGGDGSGTGRLDVVSGEVVIPSSQNWYLSLGLKTDSFGQLNVSGGSIVSACERNLENGICLGFAGDANAQMNVSGGIVRVPRVMLNQYEGANNPKYRSVLNVAGGLVDCYQLGVATFAQRFCDVNLTGGEIRVGTLTGGSGTSSFVADGGVLSTADDANVWNWTAKWITKLSSAKVGANGLVLDVKYPVASDQTFGDADGAAGAGLIVKKGAATLTQSGALQNGVTAVAEGELVYSAATAGRFVVTNGASLRLAGNGDKSFAGLSLGDAATEGAIMFELGRTVTLASEPEFAAARVSVSGTMSAGTYTLLKLTGEASAEACATWESLALAGGQAEGFDCVFAASTANGETAFQLVVTVSQPLADDDFVVPSSADGVKLWSGVAAGDNAYRLVNGTYAKIEATTSAVVTESLTVAGWTEVFVPAGETLTLSGMLLGGGIRKTGEGELIVSGVANRLGLGVKLAGGTIRLADAGSLGLVRGAGATLELKQGEIDFGGAVGNLPAALRFVNAKGETVLFGGSGDLVFEDYQLGQGSIVKVGGGRISLRTKANLTTSALADPLVIADGELAFEQVFDAKACIYRDVYVGTNGIACTVQPQLSSIGGDLSLGNNVDNSARTFYLGVNEFADAAIQTVTSPKLFFTNTFVCANNFKVGTVASGTGRDLSPEIVFVDAKLCTFWAMELASRVGVTTKFRATNSRLGISNGSGLSVSGAIDAVIDNSIVGTAASYYSVLYDSSANTMNRLDIFTFGQYATGTIVLKNGTDFRSVSPNRLWNKSEGTVSFTLDGAFWRMEKGKWNGSAWVWNADDETFLFVNTPLMQLVAGEDGFVVEPRTGHKVTFGQPLSGEGGFVKRGGDVTLRFGTAKEVNASGTVTNDAEVAATLCTTGWNVIEAGTVEVAANAVAAGAKIDVGADGVLDLQGAAHPLTVAGAGEVRNGTLGRGAKLFVGAPADSVLTLKGVTLDGAKVDVGNMIFTKPYPTGIKVAKLGVDSTFKSLRYRGVDRDGNKIAGRFAVDASGNVLMDIGPSFGLVMIVR